MASNNLTLHIDIERTTTRWRRKTKNLTLEISEELTREWLRRKTKDLELEISEDLAREWFICVGAEIVVRCKDCYWHTQCRFEQELGLEGFCSKGERREDGKQ